MLYVSHISPWLLRWLTIESEMGSLNEHGPPGPVRLHTAQVVAPHSTDRKDRLSGGQHDEHIFHQQVKNTVIFFQINASKKNAIK